MKPPVEENVNLIDALVTFPGIRSKLAGRLISHFGANGLVSHMRNWDAESLSVIEGISTKKANILLTYFFFVESLIDLALFLDEHGFKKKLATRFYGVWGDKALEVIKANPYVLLAILDWPDVDPIGRKLGSDFHPCRVIGAIEWCLYHDIEEGKHTYTDHHTLKTMVCKLIECDNITFERGLKLALRTSAVIEHLGAYQAPATHWYERLLERFLRDNDHTGLSEYEIGTWIENSPHKLLTPSEQRVAVKNALKYRISAYCGRGGRGKTWTLKAIANGAREMLKKERIYLAAVAAKAVNRMQSETGFPSEYCRTVSSLLHTVNSADLRGAMVIVDEASMLSMIDAFRLVKKLPHDAHLVLLGDHYQIPSIQAGKFFYDIVKNDAVPNVELTISKRFDEKTDQQLEMILKQEFPVFDDYEEGCGTGLYRCLVTSPDPARIDPITIAEDEAVEMYLQFRSRGETAQIISPLRKIEYPGSSERINAKAHARIFGREATGQYPKLTPVVWTSNMRVDDGNTRLSNGSAGYIVETFNKGRYTLAVEFEFEGVVRLLWSELEHLDYAYCLSVHRAQGSEWDNVLVVLPKSNTMIDCNMVYTALSRCKKRSIAVYNDHAFIRGKVAEPPAHERRRSLFLAEEAA